MPENIVIELDMPADLMLFHFPAGVDQRLQDLLDKQDRGEQLSPAERQEAEGLVALAETLTLLKLRADQAMQKRVLGS